MLRLDSNDASFTRKACVVCNKSPKASISGLVADGRCPKLFFSSILFFFLFFFKNFWTLGREGASVFWLCQSQVCHGCSEVGVLSGLPPSLDPSFSDVSDCLCSFCSPVASRAGTCCRPQQTALPRGHCPFLLTQAGLAPREPPHKHTQQYSLQPWNRAAAEPREAHSCQTEWRCLSRTLPKCTAPPAASVAPNLHPLLRCLCAV